MEEPKPQNLKPKNVIYAENFYLNLVSILEFGFEEFGLVVAENLSIEIERLTQLLPVYYLSYPENRFLQTKTKVYRNIILGKFLILYRIKPESVQVLAIYHSSVKPSKVKRLKKLKP